MLSAVKILQLKTINSFAGVIICPITYYFMSKQDLTIHSFSDNDTWQIKPSYSRHSWMVSTRYFLIIMCLKKMIFKELNAIIVIGKCLIKNVFLNV